MSGGNVERTVEGFAGVSDKGSSGSRVVTSVGPIKMGMDAVPVAEALACYLRL